jgi:hypothetical protein
MSEAKLVVGLFERLVAAPRHYFPAPGGKLDAPKDSGVYFLYRRKDDLILHVGRTTGARNGLFQRLSNHLRDQSSFAREWAIPNHLKIRTECGYRFLIVQNARMRTLLEAYDIGRLCPAHLGTGEPPLQP